MDDLNEKKSIKWFLSRIEHFNSAVPYQINLLTTCKVNIRKNLTSRNYGAIRREKSNSVRITRHLKQLLSDIDTLRDQIIDDDRARFDKLVSASRQNIVSSIEQFESYIDKLPKDPSSISYQSNGSNDKIISSEMTRNNNLIQLQLDEELLEQERQLEMAASLEHIQGEIQAVNELFHDVAQLVHGQKEVVDRLEDNVENTYVNVVNAEKQLAQAAKMKKVMYPLTGAILGTCIGGPVGLVAGLKIGTVVAVTGSILGYTGGKVLKGKQLESRDKIANELPQNT